MKTPAGEPARFLAKVMETETDDCILWPYNTRRGYAAMRIGKKTENVNSIVCFAQHGRKPTPKHEVAHNCGNGHKGCINPAHVRWATHKENCADKALHGTAQKGERNATHILNDGQAKEIMALKGSAPARVIAERFNISRETVSHIHNGRKWAHLFT